MYELSDDLFDLPSHGGPAPPWQANRLHALGDFARPALFASALDAYRATHGLTLKQLAAYLDVSASTMAAWRGEERLPRPSERARITALLLMPYVPPDSARATVSPVEGTVVASLLAEYLRRLPREQTITLNELEDLARRIREALGGQP